MRARNTLWDLFNLDNAKKGTVRKFEVELGNLGFELKEVDENENENGIRVSDDLMLNQGDEEADGEEEVELKTMKEFIDLEWRKKKGTGRDFKDIAGTFWEAASVFSKKFRKWRRKPKTKKLSDGDNGVLMVKKPNARRLRETQSEVGDYGMERRSCDTDPRLSIDAGRMSLDDSRYSFDEPRASWDGYLIGRVYPRLTPMVSLVEDAKLSGNESDTWVSDGERSPGGSAHNTKYYYSESLPSQRQMRSFDRSNSLHRRGMVTEVDDLKLISNAKVSPATTELFYGAKLLITESDLRDTKAKSEKDEHLESSTESSSKEAACTTDPVGVNQKGLKKSWRWHKKWNFWGLMQRRAEPKFLNEETVGEGNVSDRPVSDSWQKLSSVSNGEEANGSVGQKLIRSYSVRCRNTCKMAGLVSNTTSGDENRGSGLKRREEFMLQRNRSARYSPNNLDNGLLRFYLTPLRSYRRSKSAGKSKLKNSHSLVRSGLVN